MTKIQGQFLILVVLAGALAGCSSRAHPGTTGPAVYVACDTWGTVTPIRTATNTALPPIKMGCHAESIAIAS